MFFRSAHPENCTATWRGATTFPGSPPRPLTPSGCPGAALSCQPASWGPSADSRLHQASCWRHLSPPSKQRGPFSLYRMTAAPPHTPSGPTALTPAFPPDPSSTIRISTVLPFPDLPSASSLLVLIPSAFYSLLALSVSKEMCSVCLLPSNGSSISTHSFLQLLLPSTLSTRSSLLLLVQTLPTLDTGVLQSSECLRGSSHLRDIRASGGGQVQNILEGVHQDPRPSRFQKGSKSGGTRGKRKVMSRGRGTMAGAGRTAEGPCGARSTRGDG